MLQFSTPVFFPLLIYIVWAKSKPQKKDETMRKESPLPENADALLAFGQSVATVLSEKRHELGISKEVEALLRASIGSATFAINTYLAVLAGARKSPIALRQVKEAKSRCDRSVLQLRRRITRGIAQMCRYLSTEDLTSTAQFVIELSS